MFRAQLEERRNQELRSQYLDRVQEFKNYCQDKATDPSNTNQSVSNSLVDMKNAFSDTKSLSNGKLKDPLIQFTLGGDKYVFFVSISYAYDIHLEITTLYYCSVNWTGEELPSSNTLGIRIQSKSQPQLTRSRGGTPGSLRYSQLPPRRPPSLPSGDFF